MKAETIVKGARLLNEIRELNGYIVRISYNTWVFEDLSEGVRMRTERKWGYYDVLYETEHSKTKILSVDPHAQLSLQKHEHRDEHWVVLEGIACVSDGEAAMTINAGEYIYIPIGQLHLLSNASAHTQLLIMEVQYSKIGHCDESDITRYNEDGTEIES